jgi:hypothetical protein
MLTAQSGVRPGETERSLPCDALLPGARIVIDRAVTLAATPADVWPWLVQIGKDRAGWYFPRAVELLIPRGHRGARRLEPDYQELAVGTAVRDWGPGTPTLEAVVVDAPHDIGYRSRRGQTDLTWELSVQAEGLTASRLHLRLRIDRPDDWRSPIIASWGGWFDWVTVAGLFAGLRERLAP